MVLMDVLNYFQFTTRFWTLLAVWVKTVSTKKVPEAPRATLLNSVDHMFCLISSENGTNRK